ncbi:hypothetical protein ACR0ST_01920 [Aliidiomarina sp. Khilg15.8]
MNIKTSLTAIAGLVLAVSSSANASIEWSGFANIAGGATTASDETLFGYDNDLDFNQDSLFALQARASLSDRISVTTQIMSRGEDNFDLGVEWAYLQYQVSDKTSINAGKLRLPLYMYSDSIDVGYSYHWLRTPQATYRAPFNNYTGVSLQHNTFMGDWMLSGQLIGGNMREDIVAAGTENPSEINNLVGFNTSAVYNNLTLRVGYYTTNDVTIDIQSTDALAIIQMLMEDNQFAAANALDVQQERGTFASVGFMYDNFNWFVGGEYTELEVKNSYVPKQRSSYVTAGKRFGQYTLHATFAQTDDEAQRPQDAVVDNPMLAQFVAFAAEAQVSKVNYSSVGARYELSQGVALKFDFTHADDRRNDRTNNLLSAAVHVVF